MHHRIYSVMILYFVKLLRRDDLILDLFDNKN
jgi:hypothetical protein